MADKILVSREQIEKRLEEIARQIALDYKNKSFVLIGILKGSVVTMADLMRALYSSGCNDFEISFVTLRSYSSKETSSNSIKLVQDVDIDLADRDVIIIDDIFDTGKSFQFIDKLFREKGAKSVEGFALLAKPDRHQVVYRPKYVGFKVPNVWVMGYGMDFDEKGRGNQDVIAKENG